jgi:TRAP-type transport system small permease protein
MSGAPQAAPNSGAQGLLFYIGAGGLLAAVAIGTVAVVARHLGRVLLGNVELIQTAIVLISSASLVATTLTRGHASVRLLLNRLTPAHRTVLMRLNSALLGGFFLLLSAGSAWIALDLSGGREESELLHIPYAPLRWLATVATLAAALIGLARAIRPAPR